MDELKYAKDEALCLARSMEQYAQDVRSAGNSIGSTIMNSLSSWKDGTGSNFVHNAYDIVKEVSNGARQTSNYKEHLLGKIDSLGD